MIYLNQLYEYYALNIGGVCTFHVIYPSNCIHNKYVTCYSLDLILDIQGAEFSNIFSLADI